MTTYRFTSLQVNARLTNAPVTSGTTSGLTLTAIVPTEAVIRDYRDGKIVVELTGPRVLKDGTSGRAWVTVKVAVGDSFYPPAPAWVLDMIRAAQTEVTA